MAVETAVGPRVRAGARPVAPALGRITAYALLAAALGSYLWLAYLYQSAVPAWEAPDETGHFAYVRHLVEERDFPRRTVGGSDQFHQPPLAYLIGAVAIRDLDLSLFDRVKPNPAFIWTRKGDQPNAMVHTRDEGQPYNDLYEALHRLRLLAIICGAGCVLATFALARTVFPARPVLAAAAAAFVAGIPQFVFATSVLNNDALASLLCAVATVSLARIVTGRDESAWEHARLGLWLGLAVLTKVNAFALVAVAAGVLALRLFVPRPGPLALKRGAATGAVLAAVGGWWYVRNYLLYRGLLANQSYIDDQTLPQIAAFGLAPAQIFEGFVRPLFESSVAQFGWMTIKAEPILYAALAAVLGAALVGLVFWTVARSGTTTERRALAACTVLVVALVGLIFARWVTTIGNHYPQGRYLFLALPALALLVVVGLDALLARRAPAVVALALGLGLAGATYQLAGAYSAPAYRPLDLWLDIPATIQHRVGYVLGAQLHLVGYDADRVEVSPGETVALDLYWQALAQPPTDYHTFVHVALPSGEPVAQHDTVPGAPAFPPARWLPGDVLRQRYPVAIPADTPPGRYRLLVGAYRFPELTRLPATAPDDGRDYLEIGTINVK